MFKNLFKSKPCDDSTDSKPQKPEYETCGVTSMVTPKYEKTEKYLGYELHISIEPVEIKGDKYSYFNITVNAEKPYSNNITKYHVHIDHLKEESVDMMDGVVREFDKYMADTKPMKDFMELHKFKNVNEKKS